MTAERAEMPDLARALDTRVGLVSAAAVLPPCPPAELLWRSVIRLAVPDADHPSGETLSTTVAGAYGPSRHNALLRGVGEAVERFALFDVHGRLDGAVEGSWADAPHALPWDETAGLYAPEARTVELTWYPARRLRDGALVHVPAELVDYPTSSVHAHLFEPSPSGAASGIGCHAALRSALCEVVERDAFLVAWQRRLRLRRVDLDAVCRAADARGDRRGVTLRDLLATAQDHGASITAVDLPTGIDGVVCTAAFLVHDQVEPPLAAVGCNATDDVTWSILGAVTESLHLRSALMAARPDGGFEPVALPRTDDERFNRLGSTAGIADIVDWMDVFDGDDPPPEPQDVSLDELVDGVLANGGDPLAVEVTERLPESLRTQGWAVVKVVPVGYQALRMDETRAWSWNLPRLASAVERTGRQAADDDGRIRPHPLP